MMAFMTMKREFFTRLVYATLSLAMLPGCASAQDEFKSVPVAEAFSARIYAAEEWNDGKAEIAEYSARRTIYDKARNYDEMRILVMEPMRTDLWVKPEPPYEGKPTAQAIKYNVLGLVQTEQYPYHLMYSAIVDRMTPLKAIRATYSSQEWCGITTKEIALYTNPPHFRANSYWDMEGLIDRNLRSTTGTLLLEDQLGVTLRACMLKPGEMVEVEMIPHQMSNKAPTPEAMLARIKCVKNETGITAGGYGYQANKLTKYLVEYANGQTAEYYFGKDDPRLLVQYSHSDGRAGKLKRLKRYAYWERGVAGLQ